MNKFLASILLCLVLALGMAGIATASSVTVNVPTAAQAINGSLFSYNLTLNVSTEDALSGVTNVTLTSGSTVLDFEDSVNFTEGITELSNRTLDTTGLNDGAATITISMYNDTAAGTTTATGTVAVTIDNTAPLLTTPSYDDSIKKRQTLIFSIKANDATSMTYSSELKDGSGTTVSTKTGATPTWSGDDFDEQGVYTITVTATDAVGKTATSSYSLTVNPASSNSGYTVVQQQQTTQKNNTALIAALIIIGYVVFFMKKK